MSVATPSLYRSRRDQLLQHLQGGVAILPTAPEQVRNADAHYPYRFDSSFYYLTGFDEPESILVLIGHGGGQARHILFCREKNLEREIWDGYRHGPENAKETFAFDEAYPVESFAERLPDLLKGQTRLAYPLGENAAFDQQILTVRRKLSAAVERTGEDIPQYIQDLTPVVAGMRLVKDVTEIGWMQRAADISAAAHVRAMQFTKPGCYEYQVEAEILHEFVRSGARSPAYGSIVAGGSNACVLHYVSNRDKLRDGDLLLIDAGCEYEGYAGDITRTFPVNGRFSAPQRDLYQLVLDAQKESIQQVAPGKGVRDAHFSALRVLAQGMIDLKLLTGTVDEVLETESYKQYYMHGTGHWLGLDVHDCGRYKHGTAWTPLAAGMVVTVEPGIYVRPAENAPSHFWDIGIRIEDDVLVTADGPVVMTANAPKEIHEIESLMQSD